MTLSLVLKTRKEGSDEPILLLGNGMNTSHVHKDANENWEGGEKTAIWRSRGGISLTPRAKVQKMRQNCNVSVKNRYVYIWCPGLLPDTYTTSRWLANRFVDAEIIDGIEYDTIMQKLGVVR